MMMQTKFKKFIERDTIILQELIKIEGTLYTQKNIDNINHIPYEATSGFHDLYLKCLLFKELASPFKEIQTFEEQIPQVRILIELLFSPVLESAIYECKKDKADNKDINYCVMLLRDNSVVDKIYDHHLFQNNSERFQDIFSSTIEYIEWYKENEETLKNTKTSLIAANKEQKNFADFSIDSKWNINQDENKLCTSANIRSFSDSGVLGTTGMGECVAIIGIFKNAINESLNNTTVFLMHASSLSLETDIIDNIDDQYSNYLNRSYCLIGGEPLNIGEYLPIITNSIDKISDVRLCGIDLDALGCMVYPDEKTDGLNIIYTGDIDNLHKPIVINSLENKRKLSGSNISSFYPSQKRVRLNNPEDKQAGENTDLEIPSDDKLLKTSLTL